MSRLFAAVRIAIAVAVINGAGRTALVYWSYYQFQDAAQQLALFGYRTSPEVLRTNCFDKAMSLFIPISEDQIQVTREGPKTQIAASYVHPVEYFPHRMYPLKLSFTVEGMNMMGDPYRSK